MKKLLLTLACAGVLLSSCDTTKETGSGESSSLTAAKGGRYYGGVFKVNESDYIKNLFPHNITDAISYRVANQVYEGLMKFNQADLSLIKGIAEDYSVDPSKTVYTFKIRKGVFFHDNECFPGGKGRELTAEDVKFCFTQLCTQNINNQGFSVFQGILKGADEYYKASEGGKKTSFEVEGIKVVDPNTIQFTLTAPNSIFLYNLARPFTYIFPKEALEKYGLEMRTKAVGTGPFKIFSIEDDISIILKKNENYWGSDEHGNKLPFLDAIKIKFIKDKKTELLEFKKGNLDMMYRLPTDHIIEILEEVKGNKGQFGQYDLQRTPEMATHFLSFLNQGKIFNNKDLRKAFSFAIDRKKILEFVLNGEGYAPATHGITPIDIFKNPVYDVSKINGYDLNLDSAKYYLKKAGYPDGKGFPKITLELNSDGERNAAVAEEIQKQLKEHLNISIELNIVPFAQLVENMINGKSDFFRGGWIADYPNPENFLWFFYGKTVPASLEKPSYPNMMRYKSDKFDKLYEEGLKATTQEEAFKHFLEAENIVMQDAPIMVLWYDEGYRLMQAFVKNFPNNAMQYRDFTNVYFEYPKKADM
ncbi:MAG: ABC transporter substrate-binding protein [Sporocytophaga sp.]|uniref:ABC transporter substrate-binding protein n=1 Tax=Sporocytophaga sp. TaxID=2231183 RepID=UPI001B1F7938|nr:ABC transporter substrate-binding protein [Sporocytophaga sp.]MBO9698600.1 ABC transporter substrate-binding protein [Sporocytophaga sp.]